MKKTVVFLASSLLFLVACGEGSSSDPTGSGSCILPVLTNGAKATYTLSLRGAAVQTIELEVVGETADFYSVTERSGGSDITVEVGKLCQVVGDSSANLSTEAIMILFGGFYGVELENLGDDSNTVQNAINWGGDDCTQETITVPAGEFDATECVSYPVSPTDTPIEQVVSYNVSSDTDPIPFRGLVQSTTSYNNGDDNSIVQLKLWNGI